MSFLDDIETALAIVHHQSVFHPDDAYAAELASLWHRLRDAQTRLRDEMALLRDTAPSKETDFAECAYALLVEINGEKLPK